MGAASGMEIEMVQDDFLLAPGTRLVHVGPHKTGTTAVQGAFHRSRKLLRDHGVGYFGEVAGVRHLRGALAVTQRRGLLGETVPDMIHWTRLVEQVAAEGDRRVLVSSEFFADAKDAVARQVVSELAGPRGHVVVTLRPLAKIMPSQWQQYVQNGQPMPYPDWLDGILNRPVSEAPTPTFWQRHRHDKLIARWAGAAGASNVTVVVVDESHPLMLLRTFESLLGLPDGFLVPEEGTENRSLTFGEVELIRLINEEFKRREWPGDVYARFMRRGAVRHLKVGYQPMPGEPRIVTPAWALKRASEIGAEMVGNISALGVRIVGDISCLSAPSADVAQMGADSSLATPLLSPAAASKAVLGAMIVSEIPDKMAASQKVDAARRQARLEDRPVRELDGKSLARILIGRGARRARRALRRR
jgi:hypothetical protein